MLTRSDLPYEGRCEQCQQMADLCERGGKMVCYLCCIHLGSLPPIQRGVSVVVTEVRA